MNSGRQDVDCDLLVIGGGINGTGIARDAAGRGLSVVLCEKDDLASHTSSASSKLIHGGIRYLEHYEFGLVRKALIEREVLLRAAPHIMRPMRFVLPHDAGQRPVWMVRAGLFLYDHLARRELLPPSAVVDLRHHAAGLALKPEFVRGFIYSDVCVDDARLVILNAIDAAEKGATILTRTVCIAATREVGSWSAVLRHADKRTSRVRARCLVNAAGPWVSDFLQAATPIRAGRKLRLVKGSHIVVRRLFEHDCAYILQHPDGRIVFAIPYENDFTLIGTTDVEHRGTADHVAISDAEIAYLCELTARYFRKAVTAADVVWSYSGVRPLLEDASANASAVTRDYRLELEHSEGGDAPLLNVYGGKITTYRKLAEEAVNLLAPALGKDVGAWTAQKCLPGGDLATASAGKRAPPDFDSYVQDLQRRHPWLPQSLLARYAHAYGTRIEMLVGERRSLSAMGVEIAPGLFEVEVDYLMRHEWAVSAEDVLWRRSKLGLHVPADAADRLNAWMENHRGMTAEPAYLTSMVPGGI